MCCKNCWSSGFFSVTVFSQKSTVANFHPTVARMRIPTSNLANPARTNLRCYIESFIKFGEVFKTVQLFECNDLLILKFRKFSVFSLGVPFLSDLIKNCLQGSLRCDWDEYDLTTRVIYYVLRLVCLPVQRFDVEYLCADRHTSLRT